MPSPSSPVTVPDDAKRLRVGVLTDGRTRPWMVGALSGWSSSRPDVAIVHLRTEAGDAGPPNAPDRHAEPAFPSPVARASFQVLRRLEARLIRGMTRNVALLREHRAPGASEAVLLPAAPADAARRIASLRLDLIVGFGPQPLAAALAGSTRLGVVSVRHEGEFDASPETAGFWQVLERRSTTCFALLAHDGTDAPARVLVHGNVRNRASFLYNQLAVQKKGLHALQRILRDTVATGGLPAATAAPPMPDRPSRGPSVREQAVYTARLLNTAIGSVLRARGLARAQRWTVHFAPVDWKRLDMRQATPIPNPRNTFLADPFVLEEGDRTFCFVEELSFASNRGHIAVYELRDKQAVRIGPAIVEPFHMSFPFLFRHAGALFMVPETGEHRDIRVYRCVGLPDRWELAQVLMSDVATADTMLFEHGGRWWMLTNLDPADTGDCCGELHLFHADHPLSTDWQPHPMNPVVTDARRARNGGLLRDGATLYRVSQRQGFNTYGSDFAINRIEVLTPDAYAEAEVPTEDPDSFGRPGPVHHLSGTDRMSVFDVWRWESPRT